MLIIIEEKVIIGKEEKKLQEEKFTIVPMMKIESIYEYQHITLKWLLLLQYQEVLSLKEYIIFQALYI